MQRTSIAKRYLDVSKELASRIAGDRSKVILHQLDFRMIGRNAETNKPVRSWKSVKHVHTSRSQLFQQVFRSVERGWARSNNANARTVSRRSR
jgi:hypothetical protein